ncbi:MAG TPA: hypothetical protein VFS96_03180, partial [Nitrolancea sp.]|nr:hypothetical protein [Nitrolancea sp.]
LAALTSWRHFSSGLLAPGAPRVDVAIAASLNTFGSRKTAERLADLERAEQERIPGVGQH